MIDRAILTPEDVATVSYTHLDVYKRQILKRPSLFAMFCLSYLPLLFLLSAKVILANKDSLVFGGFTFTAIELLITKFGFVLILLMLSLIHI